MTLCKSTKSHSLVNLCKWLLSLQQFKAKVYHCFTLILVASPPAMMLLNSIGQAPEQIASAAVADGQGYIFHHDRLKYIGPSHQNEEAHEVNVIARADDGQGNLFITVFINTQCPPTKTNKLGQWLSTRPQFPSQVFQLCYLVIVLIYIYIYFVLILL